jgi:hypothetical protein
MLRRTNFALIGAASQRPIPEVVVYFPPLKVVSRIPGTAVAEEVVTLPRVALEALLRHAFSGDAFDAEYYRATSEFRCRYQMV